MKLHFNLTHSSFCVFFFLMLFTSNLQLVPSGPTVLAVRRNVTVFKNIPLAATPKQGAVSVGPHTMARSVRKVGALPQTPGCLFTDSFRVQDQQNEVVRNVSGYVLSMRHVFRSTAKILSRKPKRLIYDFFFHYFTVQVRSVGAGKSVAEGKYA